MSTTVMPRKPAASTAERCPNCNAFLPAAGADQTHKHCEYCGIAIELPSRPLPPSAPSSPSAVARSSSGGGANWWAFLLVPFLMSGGIFWLTQRRLPAGRTPEVLSTLRSVAGAGDSRASQAAAAPSDEELLNAMEAQSPTKKPRAKGHEARDPRRLDPCHVSGVQMSAVVEANQVRAKKCFEAELARFPATVGLTSDWEVELDGSGKVYAARGRLHLLDYQRAAEARAEKPVTLPGAAALSCMEGVVKGWAFPAYSPKDGARLRMKCSFNFSIKDL